MIGNLTLPLDRLRPVRIRELEESALCLSYDRRGIHILVQHSEGRSTAVLLNGEYAFHSFEVDVRQDWKGIALTDYDIVVDVSSAFDSENQWPTPGTITLGHNGVELGVTVKDRHGFTDKERLKLDIAATDAKPNLAVSFARWAFRVREGDQVELIWIEVDTGEGTS